MRCVRWPTCTRGRRRWRGSPTHSSPCPVSHPPVHPELSLTRGAREAESMMLCVQQRILEFYCCCYESYVSGRSHSHGDQAGGDVHSCAATATSNTSTWLCQTKKHATCSRAGFDLRTRRSVYCVGHHHTTLLPPQHSASCHFWRARWQAAPPTCVRVVSPK